MLRGRAIDLEKAFKQLGRKHAHGCFSICAAWNPLEAEVELLEALVMPFGAKARAHSFHRLARALSVILNVLFLVANNHDFDDYPLVGPEVDEQNMEDTAMAVVSLLGRKVKTGKGTSLKVSPTS